MSLFTGLIGDITGLTSISNRDLADISTAKQKELADYTDKLQRAYTKDQFSLQREGLEKAGYNPLLALGSSAAQEGIQLGAGASASGSGDGLFSKISSALQLKQQKELNDSTINKNNADANSAKSLADYYKTLAASEREKIHNYKPERDWMNRQIDSSKKQDESRVWNTIANVVGTAVGAYSNARRR